MTATASARRPLRSASISQHCSAAAASTAISTLSAPAASTALIPCAGLSYAPPASFVAAELPSPPCRRCAPAIAGVRHSLGRRRYACSLAAVAPRLPPRSSHSCAGAHPPHRQRVRVARPLARAAPARPPPPARPRRPSPVPPPSAAHRPKLLAVRPPPLASSCISLKKLLCPRPHPRSLVFAPSAPFNFSK